MAAGAGGSRHGRGPDLVSAGGAAACIGHRCAPGLARPGHHRARWQRRAADPCRQQGRRMVRAGLCPRAGPAVADADEQARGGRPARRDPGPLRARYRQIPAHAGRAAQRRSDPCANLAADAGRPAGIRRRRQCVDRPSAGTAATRVPAAAHPAGALGAGRYAGLADHDGVGPGRQLEPGDAAHATGAGAAGGAHQ
ncbi:hypothetical protein D3C81_1523920 [compost metagenome]